MATTLTIEEHLATLLAASERLEQDLRQTSQDAPVPACPGWDARALLAHIVMVHEWATSNVRGEGGTYSRSQAELRSSQDDLFPIFSAGADRLITALHDASDDLDAKVFLRDAPAPRRFWARRQAHETTIHSVDALAARLGRTPTAAEVDVSIELALDGVDELLLGFVPRGRSHWNDVEPFTLAVQPSDSDRRWLLRIDPERIRAAEEDDETADVVFSGTALALYLGLWNRGDEITQTGSASAIQTWRHVQQVHWS